MFFTKASEAHIKKERNKARELRKTGWWRQQLSAGVCHYCQQSFTSKELTMDHKIPVVRGGKSTKGNVVAACKTCNSQKSHRTPVEMVLENLK